MTKLYIDHISAALQVKPWQVENCIELISDGATIPFISRYRKERTGGLDETQVAEIKHYHLYFLDLDKRKAAIIKSVSEQEKMTDDLQSRIDNEVDLQRLEDLYLPFRPKRRTKASIAKEKGLGPLAEAIFQFKTDSPMAAASGYLNENVADANDALEGAGHIVAEWISEMPQVRSALRDLYTKWGYLSAHVVKGKEEEEESQKYLNYYNFRQKIDGIMPHRLLALLRGANEGVLSLKIEVKEEFAFERISAKVYDKKKRPSPELKALITDIIADSYNRLLASSIENETLKIAKEKADIESVNIFGENLRELLLAPPVGQKRTLAIDPGFRTGCKVVCLDSEGNLLHNDTIYPHPPVNERVAAMKKITQLVESYKIEVIAIGNGTAGRETEGFIKKIALPEGIKVYSVSEDGASIYSASAIAREEFPQYDVTVRGAVSIGRRLMDPLAELVKIDPKSIGVGQYQHDVDQTLLKERLDNTVESCVNSVGVNLNTASRHLLSYVSGVGPALALNIVEYRKNNGAFKSRAELSKVKLLGPKAFEQCAGFMRIPGAENPLDNSAVHPERYKLIEQMAADLNCTLVDLMQNSEKRAAVDLSKYVSEDVGLPTLNDIMAELAKPGRDPRAAIKVFEFSDEIRSIEDVQIGMELPGIVVNITAFGAFVDIGIKDNGLIHISKMGKAKLKIHQHILTRVEDVDLRRHRIALSLK